MNSTITIHSKNNNNNNNNNKNSNSFKNSKNTQNCNNKNRIKKYPNLSIYFPSTCDSLVKKVCSWTTDTKNVNTCRGGNQENSKLLSNQNMETGVFEILETLLTLIVEDLKESEELLLVSLFFADKYVKKTKIRQSQILWLILTSFILSFKMYAADSNKINLKKIEKRFSIDLLKNNIIGKMEIQFLQSIDYNLCIDENSITSFITCLFIDFKINCQSNLDMIQNLLFKIQNIVTNSSSTE